MLHKIAMSQLYNNVDVVTAGADDDDDDSDRYPNTLFNRFQQQQ